MRIFDLAVKDLLQVIRDWHSALFLVAMPLVFTLFFGFIFNRTAQENSLAIALVNQDSGGALSARIQSALALTPGLKVDPQELSPESASAGVAAGRLAAALIVPQGYSSSILAGEEVPLQVIAEPGSSSGQTAVKAIQAAIQPVLGAAEAARLSADFYASQRPFAADAERQAFLLEGLDLASTAWQQAPFGISTETAGQDTGESSNGFSQASPGMLVQFSVFGLVTSAMVVVLERKSRTLERMLTTSFSRSGVIAGHLLAMFAVVFVQQLILVAAGQFLFGVDYLRQPLGILLLIVCVAFWSASLGLLIGVFVKGEEQVILWTMAAMFLFSALGGAWFPLEATGKVFNAIGHLTPTAWAMDGFQNIVLRGLGFGSLLLPAGILLAYALGFFTLAAWRFKRVL